MPILLLRHGEKQISASNNPPLNENGMRQAQHLADLVRNGQLPLPDHLWASQKLRSFQTLGIVADNLNLTVQIQSDLDEKSRRESQQDLFSRVGKCIHFLERQKPESTFYLCSHFDWVEAFLSEVPWSRSPTSFQWNSGQWILCRQFPTWEILQEGVLKF